MRLCGKLNCHTRDYPVMSAGDSVQGIRRDEQTDSRNHTPPPDGQVLTGRGRNVPATMERIYNQALNSTPRRHVRFMGHLNPGENRYRGTYQVQFGYRSGSNTRLDGVVQAEVK
jgi:hypothetical protein